MWDLGPQARKTFTHIASFVARLTANSVMIRVPSVGADEKQFGLRASSESDAQQWRADVLFYASPG